MELISKARSKDRGVPLERTLLGGVQPIWLVGPCCPRYIYRTGGGLRHATRDSPSPQAPPITLPIEGARGRREVCHHVVHLHHSRRQPDPVEARRPPAPASPFTATKSTPRRPRLPRHHRSHGEPELYLLCAATHGWSAPPFCLPLSAFVLD